MGFGTAIRGISLPFYPTLPPRPSAMREEQFGADPRTVVIRYMQWGHFLHYPNPETYEYVVQDCPVKCKFMQSASTPAHAVLFFLPGTSPSALPPRDYEDQLFLGFSAEATGYYGHLGLPAYMAQFDHTFGYPRSSETHTNVPFGPFAWNTGPFNATGYTSELEFPSDFVGQPLPKGGGDGHVISWFASNCNAVNKRERVVSRIMELGKPRGIFVDSLGACLNNKRPPFEEHRLYAAHDSRKTNFLKEYLFDLAFENVHCQDWVTEKVWQPLSVGVVPIYFGTDSVNDLLPTRDSVIRVSDFVSIAALVEYVGNLTADRALLYERHLKWRETPEKWNPKFWEAFKYARGIHNGPRVDCLLCTIASEGRRRKAAPFPSCDENVAALQYSV